MQCGSHAVWLKKERKFRTKKERETSIDTTSTVTQRNIKGLNKERRLAGQEGGKVASDDLIFLFLFLNKRGPHLWDTGSFKSEEAPEGDRLRVPG